MDYFNKLKSTVYSVKATVDSVLPGNALTRDFEWLQHVASAGPGLLWKVYKGYKKSSKKEVSLWLFEKKLLDKFTTHSERNQVIDSIRRGVCQLTRLKHPYILTVEHPLEESRDSLAFCTEPIFASLANTLGRIDNMPPTIPAELDSFSFENVEVKHGLLTLLHALSFVHTDAHILHNNICPESIMITKRGCWKLAGFEFCSSCKSSSDQQVQFDELRYDDCLPVFAQPSLNYLAPEIILGGRIDTSADIYSFGVLIFAIFNKGRPIFDYENNINRFEAKIRELKAMPLPLTNNIPDVLKEDFKLCFVLTPDLRPDASQLSRIEFLDSSDVKCLERLENMCQLNVGEKIEFLNELDNFLGKCSKRVCYWKILPWLIDELKIPVTASAALLRIICIAKKLTQNEYQLRILPPVLEMMKSDDVKVRALLLGEMQFLLENTPQSEIKSSMLPFLFSSLDVQVPALLELALKSIPTVIHLIDSKTMKNPLLPTLLRLATDVQVLSVKVNALLCIGSIVNSLERWMIMEILIPTLARINSHEPGVLMVLLGIFQVIFNNKQFNLSKEIMAKYCLPSLLMASVENGLNLVQFESFMKLIKEMLSKIEKDQRLRLEVDTQSLQETVWYVNSKSKNENLIINIECNSTKSKGSRLSLEEKKRLAYEQEQELRLRSQAPIMPIIASKEKQASPTNAFDELSFSLASSLELGGNAKQNPSPAFRPCWQNLAQQSANSTESFSEASQGDRCLSTLQSQPIIPLIPPPPSSRTASSVSQIVKKSNTNLDDPFR
ncbi:SCY1-like protein 2 [Trichinella pseudospiralis]|uniref:SCY1-like protein 2 n=1 Tax=Trichinella pseudospiralis TaxID=6337 RepID=A0A0V1JUI8_TRIPS|nr:SCY1-like protein 2 [Trichinella pseudospiralis]KRZ38633.1 SCY1-like protein 2 [Trichinella pseudospiralis]